MQRSNNGTIIQSPRRHWRANWGGTVRRSVLAAVKVSRIRRFISKLPFSVLFCSKLRVPLLCP
jgi:hypothetical protein